MKKHILALSLFAAALTAGAAVENPNRLIIHTTTGETKVMVLSDVDYLDFDEVSDVKIGVAVKDGSVTANSFTVTANPASGCASYTMSLLDGTTPVRDAVRYDGASDIVFDGLEEGKTYTVNAMAYDIYGIEGEGASVTVTTVAEPAPPKVGDYYYSDGTWSDGGLISMDANGCNAVWAEQKPARHRRQNCYRHRVQHQS